MPAPYPTEAVAKGRALSQTANEIYGHYVWLDAYQDSGGVRLLVGQRLELAADVAATGAGRTAGLSAETIATIQRDILGVAPDKKAT